MIATIVDEAYLRKQIALGTVCKPYRGMNARQFKRVFFDYEEVYILATNAKIGDLYHEHSQNHRIIDIRQAINSKGRVFPDWTKNGRYGRYLPTRRSRVRKAGYIVNELGESPCGCFYLQLPVSAEVAAKLEMSQLLAFAGHKERLRALEKELGDYRGDSHFDKEWAEYCQNNPEPNPAYYAFCQRMLDAYEAQGYKALVDEDGVLLPTYRQESKEAWSVE